MAKIKKKVETTRSEKPTSTNKSKDAGDENFLSLDAGALANLTRNIEARLKDKNSSGKKPAKGAKQPTPKPSKEKADTSSQKNGTNQKSFKGKKRDRNGDVIEKIEDKTTKSGKSKQAVSQDDGAEDEDEVLRKEILAMGGSKEDFDLLAGVESDSELEDSAQSSGKKKTEPDGDALRKELSRLLKDAGQYVPEIPDEEAEDEDVSEEADVQNSDSEDSNDDDSTSSVKEDAPSEIMPEKPQEITFPKEYSRLTVMPRSDWYNTELPSIPTSKISNGLPKFLSDRIRRQATSLLEKENELYTQIQKKSSSSSHKFYSTIMTSGTLSDKISALTLAVQESPIHSVKSLENLVSLSKKRSRAQAVDVLRSLKDLFAQGTLLPGDRKLKAFANHTTLVSAFQKVGNNWTESDALPGGLRPSHLIVWAFEDFLKEQYFEVLKVLETWCNDEIEFSRTRAVSYVYELLKEKPEQEANLLRLLVNKLGDPGKKIASRASYLLLQLGQAHPLMKPTLIKSVEEFLFCPGQGQQAKYYAVITLNQTILSTKEEEVAIQLLDIYFSLFVILLKPNEKPNQQRGKSGKGQKNDAAAKGAQSEPDDQLREKLVSGILTGINRAYPFTSSDTDRVSKHIDTLFRITHSSNFNTSIQALMLIQQLSLTHQLEADRFYRTLYESLLDPRIATSSKQPLYLNLLYKALKNDPSVKRVKAFVKRIVQVLGLHQPSFICGVFFLIRELEKTYASLTSLVDQPEVDDEDEEEVFKDVVDEEDQPPAEAVETENSKKKDGYDARKRDPQHSNADKSCLWELIPYLAHFHPSVSVSADHILTHEPLSGKADLSIHTLTHFLDRFIYRNGKASGGLRGSSIMQPLAGSGSHDLLVNANGLSGRTHTAEPVNSEGFWSKRAEDVAAEDVFFHEYFNRLGKDQKTKKDKKSAKDRGRGDGDGSDDENEIWQALVDSRPELEGDSDDDDLDMDDLESAFDEDDEEDEEDGGVIFNDASDGSDEEADVDEDVKMDEEEEVEEAKAGSKKPKASASDDEDEDAFDMDVSDDEAFRDSDEDLPSDLEFGGVELPPSPTAEKEDEKSRRQKKRKLRHLPMFASVDDYASLLADEDDGRV
ncbi:CBF/Mak21 family-domain-containing protein [Talaromyces proteolyticus]|uniref:CBF/Mak21 family-domain-containing protein n=1 Tax=Talaromyces proteolyticus TaxID=1131652 RepID=A0AAD4Q0J5_9EURO|nr:CBF/Mak21 family-domain-containing protein [Talaromyces proteolyticus]KAH8697321.1 CBF/Mak21 family-domain-containing protein [Talaromyces proteolyticus]